MNDADILEKNGGSKERILFLYLTAFEQLRLLIARFDDAKKLPFHHNEKLSPLSEQLNKIKEILNVNDGTIMDLRNSCLYEDEKFEIKHKLSKYITHLTDFIPKLRQLCLDLLSNLNIRWEQSFQTYTDLGSDKDAYDIVYKKQKNELK
jgi:hypothetical protein